MTRKKIRNYEHVLENLEDKRLCVCVLYRFHIARRNGSFHTYRTGERVDRGWPEFQSPSPRSGSFAQPNLQKHFCCSKFSNIILDSVNGYITIRFCAKVFLFYCRVSEPDSRKSYCTSAAMSEEFGGQTYWYILKFEIDIFSQLRREDTLVLGYLQ